VKNLKDSILEKLKVDDIVLIEEFPIDGTIEEIMKFLEGQNFIDISMRYGSISRMFNNMKKKCVAKFGNRLSFADTSKEKISKDNPIFYINYYRGKFEYKVYHKDNSDEIIYIVKDDKKAFLEELNKRFDW
jgi:hypothetical protein